MANDAALDHWSADRANALPQLRRNTKTRRLPGIAAAIVVAVASVALWVGIILAISAVV